MVTVVDTLQLFGNYDTIQLLDVNLGAWPKLSDIDGATMRATEGEKSNMGGPG
jgi:hypothetical protein